MIAPGDVGSVLTVGYLGMAERYNFTRVDGNRELIFQW